MWFKSHFTTENTTNTFLGRSPGDETSKRDLNWWKPGRDLVCTCVVQEAGEADVKSARVDTWISGPGRAGCPTPALTSGRKSVTGSLKQRHLAAMRPLQGCWKNSQNRRICLLVHLQGRRAAEAICAFSSLLITGPGIFHQFRPKEGKQRDDPIIPPLHGGFSCECWVSMAAKSCLPGFCAFGCF